MYIISTCHTYINAILIEDTIDTTFFSHIQWLSWSSPPYSSIMIYLGTYPTPQAKVLYTTLPLTSPEAVTSTPHLSDSIPRFPSFVSTCRPFPSQAPVPRPSLPPSPFHIPPSPFPLPSYMIIVRVSSPLLPTNPVTSFN